MAKEQLSELLSMVLKSKMLFEPVHNVNNGLQAETSVNYK